MKVEEKRKFIEFMLGADVLKFGSFITKSGRPSPYFINTGNYKTGRQICTLGNYYAAAISDVLQGGFDVMFGPAYKGIPLVTAAAYALASNFGTDKPFCFNRKEAKDHGELGNIIGYTPRPGDRVIIVEDVITAGTATRESVALLRAAARGADITDMFISFDRREKGAGADNLSAVDEVRTQFGIEVHSLVNVFDLCDYLDGLDGYRDVLCDMRSHIDRYCVNANPL